VFVSLTSATHPEFPLLRFRALDGPAARRLRSATPAVLPIPMTRFALFFLLCVTAHAAESPGGGVANVDWRVQRGDPAGTQFAAVAQIHAANVHRLRPAWEYHTGDATERSNMHVNPLVIDGVMYVTTPSMRAVALDARTGRELWTFDPAKHNHGTVIRLRNRGVTYWRGAEGARIFHFVRERVYALDATTGQLITSFGKNGFIDLRENLGVDPQSAFVEMTSPGAIYRNLLILGSRVNESYDASPGHIRAYDTVTGELKWIFHTIPRRGEMGYETWRFVPGENYGGANAWGSITVDEKRGWVFAATGSPTDDFYGGFRHGTNLFGNCVLALDATTGERKWHYQTVRHDLWDYDNPPAPILATVTSGGTSRDVAVQLTKMGFTFVLDRDTGQPVFPVYDTPVPKSNVTGEQAQPTQPVPLKPPALVRQGMTEADVTNRSPEAHRYALEQFRRYVSGSLYTPPTLQGTITLPGHLGGSEWHGGAYDAALNVLYVNVNELPTINRLRPVQWQPEGVQLSAAQLGQLLYERVCLSCHGAERQGTPPLVPALRPLQRTDDEIRTVILQGRNSMPAFSYLRAAELNAVLAYLKTAPGEVPAVASAPSAPRFSIDGYPTFRDHEGYPAIAPPWGTLSAIDLAQGEILWKVPLGEYPELVKQGIRNTGTPNFGGAVATAGGLIFIAATADEKIRAFEKHSGRVLWEWQLPAGGYATPAVYMQDGREYVAIAAGGGGKNATKSGDAIIAFALGDGEMPSAVAGGSDPTPQAGDWIELFDGKTLNGWVHLNGAHTYTVEDGAIVGRTVERSENSFLCTTREFGDFELELETMIDRVTNSGIQIRSTVRSIALPEDGKNGDFRGANARAGRVNGPQVEIRRYYPGQPTTGLLYGEAMGTGWLSSKEKQTQGHRHFIDEGWNKLRIVARGPRIQTWVNGQLIEDQVLDEIYRNYSSGFIGLQIHGLNGREPGFKEHGLNLNEPLVFRWRNIRIRPMR
jgi:quinoprotein glucose dehydrogenase